MKNKKLYGVIGVMAGAIILLAVVLGVFVSDENKKEEITEQGSVMNHNNLVCDHNYGDNEYINLKVEGVNSGQKAAACGNYIFSSYCVDFLKYAINIYKADGKDTTYVKSFDLVNDAATNKKGEIYFEVVDVLNLSERLVVICSMGMGEINTHYYNVLCYDVENIDDIKLVSCQNVSADYFEFWVKGEYLYGIGESSVMSMSFAGEPKFVDEFEVVNDGRMEIYINENHIYFITRQSKEASQVSVLKLDYEDGIFNTIAHTKLSGRLLNSDTMYVGVISEDEMGIHEKDGKFSFLITNEADESKYTAYVLDENLGVIRNDKNISKNEALKAINYSKDSLEIYYSWKDEEKLAVGLESGDVQITMYDIANQSEYIEKASVKLSESVSDDSLYKTRKALVDSERNLICIGVSSMDKNSGGRMLNGISHYVFSYEDEKLVEKAYVYYSDYRMDREYSSDETSTNGMLIGDYYYVVNTGGQISVISLDSFEITEIDIP